jgi:hypothetical protein
MRKKKHCYKGVGLIFLYQWTMKDGHCRAAKLYILNTERRNGTNIQDKRKSG